MENTENKIKNSWLTKAKHGFGKQKNKFFGLLLLTIGIAIGIGITTSFPQIAGITKLKSQLKPAVEKVVDQTEVKKQALEKLFRELTEAESKDDWQKLYIVVNPTDKKWFSMDDMILQYKKDKYSIVSTEVIVHGVSVSSDTGDVDNTVIRCKTKECTGKNKVEKRSNDQFVYEDGKWYQKSLKEPSDKARQLTSYVYAEYQNRADDKKLLIEKYGGGKNDLRTIIRTMSIMLENDPEFFAYVETWVEKNKAEASRPNVYVDSPDVIQQPVVQQQPSFNNRLNCTSNSIGNYTYTNCY